MAVANAMDIKVEVFAGKLKFSMLQFMERKQTTEIEFLTGFITENGKKYQVPTPVNDQVFRP